MRKRETSSQSAEDSAAFRVGSASLGLIVGVLAGLVVAVFVSAELRVEAPVPLLVFGLAALGAIAGYFYSTAAIHTAEGVIHLLIGLAVGAAERIINPLPEAPWWLRCLYWVGVALGLALIFRYRW